MIEREIQPVLTRVAQQYPVLTITGLRQSGGNWQRELSLTFVAWLPGSKMQDLTPGPHHECVR